MGSVINVPELGTLRNRKFDLSAAKALMQAIEAFSRKVNEMAQALGEAIGRFYDSDEVKDYLRRAAREKKYKSRLKFGEQRKKRRRKRPQHNGRRCRRCKA